MEVSMAQFIIQIFNLSCCSITILLFAVTFCLAKPPLDIIPKSLRALIKLSLPILFIFPLGTIITTIFCMTDFINISMPIINVFLAFAGNFTRITFLLICIERYLALYYLFTFEKFTIKRIGVVMFVVAVVAAFWLTIPYSFVPDYDIIDLYIITGSHFLATIFGVKVLNQYSAFHRTILFNPTTKGRYTIIENIRILRKLKTYIMISLFFAPIAPFIIFCIYIMTWELPFLPIIYTGYNTCFMLCMFWRIFQIRCLRKVASAKVSPENVQTADTAADVENVI